MNRRDDRAGPLFATGFCEQVRSRRLRAHKQRFVAGKGTSEGAAAFMNSPGVRPESCTLSDLVKGQTAEAKACRQ